MTRDYLPRELLPAHLGAELRKARHLLGLTQEAAAMKALISQPYLSRLERGLRAATVVTTERLLAMYDVPPFTAAQLRRHAVRRPQCRLSSDRTALPDLLKNGRPERADLATSGTSLAASRVFNGLRRP